MIKMPIIGAYVRFKNYERKIKLLFMIYADFESILVPQDTEKILILKNLIWANLKNMLLVVMFIN